MGIYCQKINNSNIISKNNTNNNHNQSFDDMEEI